MEGVLVSANPVLLTKRGERWSLAACLGLSVSLGSSDGCDRGRQRLCSELGAWLKTPALGGPARRS